MPLHMDPEFAAAVAPIAEAVAAFTPPPAGHWQASRAMVDAQLTRFTSDIGYPERLSAAGGDVEFHLRQGVPHAFEVFAAESAVARQAQADRARMQRSL